VAEWFKAAVLKTARGASPSWVRIPPLPPNGLSLFAPPLGYDTTAAAGTFCKRSVLLRRIRRTSARRDILNGGANDDVRRGSTRYSRRT
jgi:hypothetical protein